MHYKFRCIRYDWPGFDKLFVLRFNVYGAEELLRQLKRRQRVPRRTKRPAQPVVFQPRYYCK